MKLHSLTALPMIVNPKSFFYSGLHFSERFYPFTSQPNQSSCHMTGHSRFQPAHAWPKSNSCAIIMQQKRKREEPLPTKPNQKEKSGTYIQVSAELEPTIYMPVVQFGVRIGLGMLAAIYFFAVPVPLFFLSRPQIFAIIGCYVAFHIGWWMHYRRHGMGTLGIRMGALVDLLAAFTAATMDPFDVPPTGMLIIIAAMGNGIQHGLRVFFENIVAILLFTIPAFAVRQVFIPEALPYQLTFILIFATVLLCYTYLLLNEIELLKKKSEKLARQDPLTKLYNRNAFMEAAGYLLLLHKRERIPLVVMFADLDNFKTVNDTMGHAVGDEVLKSFASIACKLLRSSDIVARYGGDEFVFILANTTVQEARQVAARLEDGFAKWAAGRGIAVGASFGITAIPESSIDLEGSLKKADTALYEAKRNKNKSGSGIVIAPGNQPQS
ncbi:MAG: hypothetical protein B5M56_02235 [Desulfococcus sp. 4484_241]|nr:MAG: hypothetical protein B5M56_02235 [Desulfococcus sp. 4484_241]